MSAPQFVYFVRRTDDEGPVKIGCSIRPADRLDFLMTYSPYPLKVAATVAGDYRVERRFHALFRAQHSHREWFHPSPELDAVIAAVAAGTFDLGTLPGPKGLGMRLGGNGWTDATKRSSSWSHRINHLWSRGVKCPVEVDEARHRYRAAGQLACDPADAALVEAWLALHPPLRVRKAA